MFIPVAVCVPEVAPTTSMSNPVVVVVPKPAEFKSKLIPISVKSDVPELGTGQNQRVIL